MTILAGDRASKCISLLLFTLVLLSVLFQCMILSSDDSKLLICLNFNDRNHGQIYHKGNVSKRAGGVEQNEILVYIELHRNKTQGSTHSVNVNNSGYCRKVNVLM